ncbi:hypothetical protein F4X88_20765, partial [Candidatus Poribacteria bacterium]|nr:hypothetical protein [Candidatus Poribacteria bacterium]
LSTTEILCDINRYCVSPKKVIESFNLRKRAKDLLECAKRAVEISIERDEQTAIDWLESVSQHIS